MYITLVMISDHISDYCKRKNISRASIFNAYLNTRH